MVSQHMAAYRQQYAQPVKQTYATYSEPKIIQGYTPHEPQYQHYIPQDDDSSDDDSEQAHFEGSEDRMTPAARLKQGVP
jgi:hypothetical protein